MEALTLHIKNMICPRCITVLKYELEKSGVEIKELRMGFARVKKPPDLSMEELEKILEDQGFALIKSDEIWMVEQIKHAVRELLANNVNKVKNSDFLSMKIGKSYSALSKLFSRCENITIEKYIIERKIEAAQLLIKERELTLSEIAAHLGYSSVQHLSRQFRRITGLPVREFKKHIS